MDCILERNRLIDQLRRLIARDFEERVRKLLYILDPEEFLLEVEALLEELDLLAEARGFAPFQPHCLEDASMIRMMRSLIRMVEDRRREAALFKSIRRREVIRIVWYGPKKK
jgi:hypothetical protein